MSRNSAQTNQLLEKIAADLANDGCSRQLQVDTIGLVANMNRNIQVMTNIMVRMGYNIEELSRAPKKMKINTTKSSIIHMIILPYHG